MMRLQGRQVRLEPLAYTHAADLFTYCADPEVWQYLPVAMPKSEEEFRREIWSALAQQDAGLRQPFAVIALDTETCIGSTSYLDITPDEHRLEIGWTYYAKEHWRSAVNTECKYLLLEHAFEVRGCQRVAFKTDVLNLRSQRAIERLGATQEGVLRNHRLRPDGSWRSSVVYSILAQEWPTVKANLSAKISGTDAGRSS